MQCLLGDFKDLKLCVSRKIHKDSVPRSEVKGNCLICLDSIRDIKKDKCFPKSNKNHCLEVLYTLSNKEYMFRRDATYGLQ